MKGNEGYISDHGVNTTTEGGVPPPTESSNQHVIFLAIDVSKSTATTLGQGKKKITEIGISTLATSDLVLGRARGEEACLMEWAKKIRTRNFRIREWSNFQETDFVLGFGDNFKKELGNSEWISVHNAPKLIASCFGHTASPSALDGSSVDISAAKISSTGVVFPEEGGEGEKCNIIVVGNRVERKISELRDIIGFDVTKLGNVITKKAIDVLDMFRALQQNPKTFTLHSLFQELDKPLQMKANPVSFPFWWFGKKKEKKRDLIPCSQRHRESLVTCVRRLPPIPQCRPPSPSPVGHAGGGPPGQGFAKPISLLPLPFAPVSFFSPPESQSTSLLCYSCGMSSQILFFSLFFLLFLLRIEITPFAFDALIPRMSSLPPKENLFFGKLPN